MAQTSFPIKEQPLTDQQWGQVTAGQGSGVIATTGDGNYGLTKITNATDTAVLSSGATGNTAQAIVAGFYHRIDAEFQVSLPAVTVNSTYFVGLVYDPTKHAAAGGPVAVSVTTTKPAGSGKVYLPLWEVQRTPNQLLTAATIRDLRVFIAPSIAVMSGAARTGGTLPTDGTLVGTRAYDLMSGRTHVMTAAQGWQAVNDTVTVGPGIPISGGSMPLGSMMVQGGLNGITTNTNGDGSIILPYAFPNGLLSVTVTPFGTSTGGNRSCVLLDINTDKTKFSFRTFSPSSPLSNFFHAVSWTAVGW